MVAICIYLNRFTYLCTDIYIYIYIHIFGTILEAVKQHGSSLEFAARGHKAVRGVVFEAVERIRNSLEHAAPCDVQHRYFSCLWYLQIYRIYLYMCIYIYIYT